MNRHRRTDYVAHNRW